MLIECLLMSSQCQLKKKKIINTQFKIPRDEEQMQTGAAVVAKSIVNESESTLLDKLWGDTISKWPQTYFFWLCWVQKHCVIRWEISQALHEMTANNKKPRWTLFML